MKIIPVKYGKVYLLTSVDTEDYKKLSSFRWFLSSKGYAKSGNSYLPERSLHRNIMLPPDHLFVDHINGNKLDNRKINLRICTNSENLRNRGKPLNNTSGYKGVCFDKSRNKYCVNIVKDSKNYLIGRFACIIKAAENYDLANIVLFKEFSNTNFPKENYSLDRIEVMEARINKLFIKKIPKSKNKYIYLSGSMWVFSIRINGKRFQSDGYDNLEDCIKERNLFYSEWDSGITL
jgi:hypothetical protein